MHKLLTEHPAYTRAVEEAARIKGAQARHQEPTARAEQVYCAAAAAYQKAAVEALRDGGPPPERPTPPEMDPALVRQLAQEPIRGPAIPRDAERQLAPELLPLLESRAADVEETVREAADTLRGLAREASELRVTVAAQRAAGGLPALVDQGVVDVAALFALVVRGDRLLAAESPRPTWGDAGSLDPHAPRGSQTVVSFARLAARR